MKLKNRMWIKTLSFNLICIGLRRIKLIFQTSQSSYRNSKEEQAQHKKFYSGSAPPAYSTPQGIIPEIFHTINYLFLKVRDKPFTALVLPLLSWFPVWFC